MIDTTSATSTASATATVCESMALYGTAPERGELDSRVVWDEDDAIEALSEAGLVFCPPGERREMIFGQGSFFVRPASGVR